MSVSNGPILNRTSEMALKYGGGSFRDLVHRLLYLVTRPIFRSGFTLSQPNLTCVKYYQALLP